MVRRVVSMTLIAALSSALLVSAPNVQAQPRPTPGPAGTVPGSEPYSTTFSLTLTSGSGLNGYSPDPVPADRRLVIEFVSARIFVTPSEKPLVALQDAVNGAGRAYLLPLTLVSTGTFGEEYRVLQLVRLYHDGNGANGPGAQCSREQASFARLTCSFTISGYLIPK